MYIVSGNSPFRNPLSQLTRKASLWLPVLLLLVMTGCGTTKRGAAGSKFLHPDFVGGERVAVEQVTPPAAEADTPGSLGPLITDEVAVQEVDGAEQSADSQVVQEDEVAPDTPPRKGFFRSLFSSDDERNVEDAEAIEVVEVTTEVPLVEAVEMVPEEAVALEPAALEVSSGAVTQTESASRVTLRPGLLLDIKVMVAGKNQLEPDAVRVTESNRIILPMLGQVPVADFTLERLREDLTERYRRFFVNPEVLVDFARDTSTEGISPWGYVTVLGRVKNPGRIMIPATRDLTVSGAIQGAGGFDKSARINAIRVTRNKPDGSGQEQVTIDLNEVGSDGRARDDFVLGMDDIVFVPEARF
jgi:protein involved in polysaccharide export with SLBB domain